MWRTGTASGSWASMSRARSARPGAVTATMRRTASDRITGVGVSPDLKTVYVADRNGFRILGLDESGQVRSTWGRHGDDAEDGFRSDHRRGRQPGPEDGLCGGPERLPDPGPR